MDRISVFIVHSSAERFREQLKSASVRGLLRLLIVVDEVGNFDLYDNGDVRRIDLIRFLSENQIDLLHLQAVRFGSQHAQVDIQTEYKLAETLRTRLEMVHVQFVAGTISLASEGDPLFEENLQKTWNYNVVLSSEDWAGEAGFLPADLSAAEYEDLAFAASTLITSTWVWIDGIVHETIASKVMNPAAVVRLARVVLRIVDAGDLAVRVTSSALDQTGMWPVPPGCMFHSDPNTFVHETSAKIAALPATSFYFEQPSGPPARSKKKVSIKEAIVLFFQQMIHAIFGRAIGWVEEMREKAFRTIEDIATNATFGSDSEILVRISGRPRPEDGVVSIGQRLGIVASLPNLQPVSPQPSPDAWRTFVAATLGTFDGGDVAISGNSDAAPSKFVLSDRSFVAPDPFAEGGKFSISISELDALGLSSVQELTLRLFDSKSSDDLKSLLAEEPEVVKEESEEVVELGEHKIVTCLPDSPMKGIIRARLNDFLEVRENTLVWRIGKILNEQGNAALTAWMDSDQFIAKLPDQLNTYLADADKAVKKIRRRQLITAIAHGLMIIGGVIAAFIFPLMVALSVFGVFILSLFGSILAFLGSAKEYVQLQNRFRDSIGLPQFMNEYRIHCYHEYVRLTSLYEQFLDWADVVAVVLHRPFGENVVSAAAQPYETNSNVTCFVAGTPDFNSDALQGEKQRLRRNLVRRGWLNEIVNRLEVSWKPRFAQVSGYLPDEVPKPEADPSIGMYSQIGEGDADSLSSPRQHFRREVVAGRMAMNLRSDVENQMRDVFRNGDPSRLLGSISTGMTGLDGRDPSSFLTPPIEMSPLPSFDRFMHMSVTNDGGEIKQVLYGVPNVLSGVAPDDGIAREKIATTTISDRFVLAMFRVDLSRDLDPHELRLLSSVKSESANVSGEEADDSATSPTSTDF
jgi:hypothetical protein